MTPVAAPPTRARSLPDIVSELVAATPAPPAAGLSATEIAEAGAHMIERRQPLLEDLERALAAGAQLDATSRAKLDALRQIDAAWQAALQGAQTAVSQQLMAIRKLGSQVRTSASPGALKFLNIKA